MLKKSLSYLRYLLPVAVSVVLVVWIFKKVNFHEMVSVIRDGCDFRYIAIMMVLTMLAMVIRGIRWGIQLRGVNLPRVSATEESISIFGAYALNLIFTGLGEGWRCVYMSRREKAPLSTIIGTDIGDRSSDAIVIFLLSVLTFFVARAPIESFFSHYKVGQDMWNYFSSPWIWVTIFGVLGLLWSANHFFHNYRIVKTLDGDLHNVWNGFGILFHLPGIGRYIILTLGIWICYFLETYVCLFAFPFTREALFGPGTCFGLLPGLVIFVFGSYSMAVPSNGGLGPWNLAVMFALSLYGIKDVEGAAYSMVVWGCQTITYIALGIYSALYISAHSGKSASSHQ
ncbi:MAG: flippase-like domain-containing protein [Lachnoclostridium sp.]|nr:flippase-like domain-containing protein [Lachnoclostridium sp.]